ncbi:tetratricopeptide repeat protein [Planctobacterium marinum]|uniref:TPR repeat protein n=1 Tax=Planctobacterium marinum TaxID=1631968 RepID=A0AA48HG20_9ALTE|nr:hypothetical protein MACH26_12570 [Planctobacterium marinum]
MTADLFKKALHAHQSGDLKSASEYYQKLLKRAPREYNALQLLGGVYHAQGDNRSALKYLLASLKIKPDQPQVMLNVATCQRQLQEYTAALGTLSQVIRKDPANFGAFKSRMFVLVEMGDYQRAYQELDTQIHKFPGHYELYNLLGAVASECEHYQKAIKAYKKALKIRPNSDVARHNLGLAYCQNNEPENALKEYLIVLNSGKHSYQLMHNLGNAYLDLGHFEQAITYFNNALKLNYKSLDSHKKLSDSLWQSGEIKNYLRNFETAIKKYPDEKKFLYEYVHRLLKGQCNLDAKALLEAHYHKHKEDCVFQYLYGKCLTSVGEVDEARSWLLKASASNQLSDDEKLDLCGYLLAVQEAEPVRKITSEILTEKPEHVGALAWWGLYLRKVSDDAERELNNYQQLIGEYQIFDPRVDSNFYRTLLNTLTRLHLANEELIDKSSHNGTQTRRHLFKTEVPCLLELETRFKGCVEDYLTEKSQYRKWGPWPESDKFVISDAWSVRLKEQGYHKGHYHPRGQISGIFFLSLPKPGGSIEQNSGYLAFGDPDIGNVDDFPAQHLIKPEVGKLVIFPSCFWHSTNTQTLSGQKITISFDVNAPKFS